MVRLPGLKRIAWVATCFPTGFLGPDSSVGPLGPCVAFSQACCRGATFLPRGCGALTTSPRVVKHRAGDFSLWGEKVLKSALWAPPGFLNLRPRVSTMGPPCPPYGDGHPGGVLTSGCAGWGTISSRLGRLRASEGVVPPRSHYHGAHSIGDCAFWPPTL